MASSRIFVRGLPPTFTEDEFRKHFERGQSLTDVKLFPQRRIGYVGYKTPEDAAKAVKYFNKSFIRMSRIWVEPARPTTDQSIKPRNRVVQKDPLPQNNGNQGGAAATANDNPLKRKRAIPEDPKSDPKLKEFLEVMQAPSKVKSWQNEGMLSSVDPIHTDAPETQASVPEEGESDSEYQVVPKKLKPAPQSADELIRDVQSERTAKSPVPEQGEETLTAESGDSAMAENTTAVPMQAVTDADWLRSRTSRLLDLEDEDSTRIDATTQAQSLPHGDSIEEEEAHADATSSPPDESPNDILVELSMGNRQEKSEEDTIRTTGRLFLRNLSYTVSEDDLRERFSEFGDLQEVHVPINSSTGMGKGFAYILFNDSEHAVQAYKAADGTIFQGRLLHVLPAAAKKENKLDEFAISKLPLKKQKQIQKKAEASTSTFNWNALYMNADAVMSSIADRLGIAKSEVLDPTSSDAAVKQAQAETHLISETKAYFAQNGVDLDAFKKRQRGDTAILVKNFPYGTKADELRKLFEEHGQVSKFLMPPGGVIAIVEFFQAPEARAAFHSLAYRKFKDSVLFLEKAPKDLFKADFKPPETLPPSASSSNNSVSKLSTSDLLGKEPVAEVDSSTLFVRNLNFSTTTERLTEIFKPLEGFLSARVKTKTDPKKPGQVLSMGFGFLEFSNKEQAQAALAAMDGYSLDGHKLSIKASHKGADAAEERRKEDRAKKLAGRQTKIIIKNLPFEATKKDIRALFGSYGQLRSVRVPKKLDSSTRGFAFAEFTTAREAENAMDALRNTHLLGRRLVLDFAAEDPEDAEAEIEKMQQKVGAQVNKVALQRLTSGGRKKFNVVGNDDTDQV